MAFFRTAAFAEVMPAIENERVMLRPPQMADFAEWAALRERSRDFLKPWEPIWPADDLTRGAFRRRLKRYAEDQRADLSYSFFIALKPEGVLVGGITLANIRRGVAQAGSIGYWVGEPHARHGILTAALRALVPFSFVTLRLHRLEAACIPTNVASIALLEKSGFQREGYARQYLCINGMWQDHLLYARIKDEPPHIRSAGPSGS
jgi:[ribosomal protein S5]-alanine N-acetyltransferase